MRLTIRVSALLLFALGSFLWGQSQYSVGIALADRTVVRVTSPPGQPATYAPAAYNPATQMLDLAGSFTIPSTRNVNDFTINVQARTTIVNLAGVPGANNTTRYNFTVSIPLPGANPGFGGWTGYTFGTILSDPDNIAKPIIAELYDQATSVLRARQVITIFDARNDPRFELNGAAATVSEGMQLEVSGQGLDNLEPLHKDGLPYANVPEFESVLSADFRRRNAPQKALSFGTGPEQLPCRSINNFTGFTSLPEHPQIVAEANLQYATYLAAQESLRTGGILSSVFTTGLTALFGPVGAAASAIVSGLSQAALQRTVDNSCVREPVLPTSFNVCAGSLRGDGLNLRLNSVSNVDLSLGADQLSPASFFGQPTLGSMDAQVKGTFKDLYFQYNVGMDRSCKIRPIKSIPDSSLLPRPELDQQRVCPSLSMNASGARSSVALPFTLDESAASKEEINFAAGSQPASYFTLTPPRNTSNFTGMCGGNLALRWTTEAMLDRFWPHITNSLTTVWASGAPRTRHAQALESIFRTWEPGTWGEAQLQTSATGADHTLKFEFFETKSKNLRDRFYARLDVGGALNTASIQPYVFTAPSAFPCAHNLCAFSGTESANLYDVSFMYTTGAMNHIIGQLAATQLLTFNWQPTYAELGVAPPPGVSPQQQATLDGPTLSAVNPVFSQLGASPATIRVYPVNRPFLYINPQPPRGPNYRFGSENMVYSTPHLVLEVTNAQGTWLRGAIYIYDVNYQLTPSVPSSKLSASWGQGPTIHSLALENSFTGCNGNYFGASPAGCPDAAFNALFNRLRPKLTNNLLYLTDRFPAPVNFYSGPSRRQFLTVEKYQEDHVLAFYGNLQ